MTDQIVKSLTDPAFLIALLVSIAVFATVFTLMPALGGNQLKARMKSVALERDELRAKQRARLAAETDRRRKGLHRGQRIQGDQRRVAGRRQQGQRQRADRGHQLACH